MAENNSPGHSPESSSVSSRPRSPGKFFRKDGIKKRTVPVSSSKGRNPRQEGVRERVKKWKSSLKRSSVRELFEAYDPEKHPPLIGKEFPAGYEVVDAYWVDKGRSLVVIGLNKRSDQNEYLLFEPVLTEFEYELLERLHEDLREVLILTDNELGVDPSDLILTKMLDLLEEYGVWPDREGLFRLEYYLIRNFVGWGRIDALMKDPGLEDISCDGHGIPIFLYHRQFRNIKTNIVFDEESLNSLAITLAQRSGKHISTGTPMIDATLPDGSRLQLTLGTEVTTRGTSFTIRKFREVPMSPVELLMSGTFSIEMLVFFWIAIENNKSLLFIGGTASGKTTSLNAVSLFIPPMAKVISIEDTREITLSHENWIASVTRETVGEGSISITMFDLLKTAMRQRPEYIIVGEVRGPEAQTLFQAMNTGHTTFSTMHAGSVDAAIHRLENEPLNVPRNMVQALNIVSVQALIYHGRERVRRSQEIVEIAGIDPATGNLRINTVFEYDPVHDHFTFTGRSQIYTEIAERRGWSQEDLQREITIRSSVLQAMRDQKINDYVSCSRVFQAFAINPAKVTGALTDLRAIL